MQTETAPGACEASGKPISGERYMSKSGPTSPHLFQLVILGALKYIQSQIFSEIATSMSRIFKIFRTRSIYNRTGLVHELDRNHLWMLFYKFVQDVAFSCEQLKRLNPWISRGLTSGCFLGFLE